MGREKGFQYQLVGSKHAAMLAISIYTLRHFHQEPIQILCGDDASFDAATIIRRKTGINFIELDRWEAPKEGGKGRQHANKTIGVGYSPFDKTIFLDADTTVHANLDDLWPHKEEVHLTRFSTWVTTGNMMSNRLKAWEDILPETVEKMRTKDFPAINTGVFSFSKDSTEFLDHWRELTLSNPVFMSDELAAQLIFPQHKHKIRNDRWNYSPRYSTPNNEEIRVIHYHGFQHARPEKSGGHEIWYPIYRDWCGEHAKAAPHVPKDKHLRRYLEEIAR